MASWLLSNCGGGRQGPPGLPRPPSAGKLPSHLEFAPLPDDVQLPPPGSPFWSQPHAAEVACQALAAARRDKANAGALTAGELSTQKAVVDRLQARLAETQAELAETQDRYNSLKRQSVAEVAHRLAAHDKTPEKPPPSAAGTRPGSALSGHTAEELRFELRRCQHALLREREARVTADAEAEAASERASEAEGALTAESERANELARSLLLAIENQAAAMAAAEAASAMAAHAEASGAEASGLPTPPPPPPSPPPMPSEPTAFSVPIERFELVENARAKVCLELQFLKDRLRALEADLKASREAEVRMRGRLEARAHLPRPASSTPAEPRSFAAVAAASASARDATAAALLAMAEAAAARDERDAALAEVRELRELVTQVGGREASLRAVSAAAVEEDD